MYLIGSFLIVLFWLITCIICTVAWFINKYNDLGIIILLITNIIGSLLWLLLILILFLRNQTVSNQVIPNL